MIYNKYFLLVMLLAIFDYLTKLLVYEYLDGIGHSVDINEFFSITLVHNYGAAFSLLADSSGWQRYFLSSISLIAVITITIWIFKTPVKCKLKVISLTLILSGAIGNLIDRITNGFVVDFIDFHYQDFYWPIFNFADVFITLGVVLLVIVDWEK